MTRVESSARDDAIRAALKDVLGMSVPKYISIAYGRSQKAAQIMFNQPETRTEEDENLLDEIHAKSTDPDDLLAGFISVILGSDHRVLTKIQATIDTKFQMIEVENTVRSLSRPMLSDVPEINQVEMINDRYFYAALEMQAAWAEAKKKQETSDKPVRIPYTHEQIRTAFETVIDMCRLVIELRIADESARGRETKARAYALLGAVAIQMGRYDLLEQYMAEWRDRFELTGDSALAMRVRNLLFQKELWLKKRQGKFAEGLEIAERQWLACETENPNPRWMDIEPLACAGLELAALNVDPAAPSDPDLDILSNWLERFELAPDRTGELGSYLATDHELQAIRNLADHPRIHLKWSNLMKKFGIVFFALAITAFAFQALALPSDQYQNIETLSSAVDHWGQFGPDMNLGANPGKLILDLIRFIFGG